MGEIRNFAIVAALSARLIYKKGLALCTKRDLQRQLAFFIVLPQYNISKRKSLMFRPKVC